jgi:hypothetical protein
VWSSFRFHWFLIPVAWVIVVFFVPVIFVVPIIVVIVPVIEIVLILFIELDIDFPIFFVVQEDLYRFSY